MYFLGTFSRGTPKVLVPPMNSLSFFFFFSNFFTVTPWSTWRWKRIILLSARFMIKKTQQNSHCTVIDNWNFKNVCEYNRGTERVIYYGLLMSPVAQEVTREEKRDAFRGHVKTGDVRCQHPAPLPSVFNTFNRCLPSQVNRRRGSYPLLLPKMYEVWAKALKKN